MGRKKKAPSKKKKLTKAERKSQRKYTKGPKAQTRKTAIALEKHEPKAKVLDLSKLHKKVSSQGEVKDDTG